MNSNFDLDKTISKSEILKYKNMIEVIPNIGNIILNIGNKLGDGYKKIGDNIWISNLADVDDTASITGPCIIDDYACIRHSAYIRGNVLVGKSCVVGNSVEVKNSILFDNVQVPHFNYIGDSILGYKSHFGAGAITSNIKNDKSDVVIDGMFLRKMGAIVGDYVEIGCNSVLCPGTIIGRNTNIYPLTLVRGTIDKDLIVKSMDNILNKKQIFLDFDSTIYNTDKMFADILDKCEEYGVKREKIFEVKQLFLDDGKLFNINEILDYISNEISFDSNLYDEINSILKNGKSYIYDDTYEFISKLKNKKYQVNILTYGNKEFQWLKIKYSGIESYVNQVLVTDKYKSSLDYISYENSVFIDDNPDEIVGFLSRNPIKVIRIKRKDAGRSNIVLENKDIVECESLLDIIDLF